MCFCVISYFMYVSVTFKAFEWDIHIARKFGFVNFYLIFCKSSKPQLQSVELYMPFLSANKVHAIKSETQRTTTNCEHFNENFSHKFCLIN